MWRGWVGRGCPPRPRLRHMPYDTGVICELSIRCSSPPPPGYAPTQPSAQAIMP